MNIQSGKFSVSFLFFLCLIWSAAFSQKDSTGNRIEFSGGVAMIIYQSGYAMENSPGFELAVKGKIINYISWQAGARVWFNPAAPEAFARVLVSDKRAKWTPGGGIEIGVTGRGKFGEGSQLLRETRNAMLEDINPFYISTHIAPLSFSFKNRWRFSAAEINFGSHFENIGRTLRLHVNAITISKTF